jgi:hypothetical protein
MGSYERSVISDELGIEAVGIDAVVAIADSRLT